MIPFLIITVTFILTEFSAWANHKYIMHGTMWYFHADHHKKDHKSVFERNDIFFLIYAVPSWLCIMFGMMNGYAWYTWVGFGIALYVVHTKCTINTLENTMVKVLECCLLIRNILQKLKN